MNETLIQFRGITSRPIYWYRQDLGNVAGMLFTDLTGKEYFCPLHGPSAGMDDSLRILLESANDIADKQRRNELCRDAAELSSVRPSVLDDLADEDESVRYTAGDPDDPATVPEDDNLPF